MYYYSEHVLYFLSTCVLSPLHKGLVTPRKHPSVDGVDSGSSLAGRPNARWISFMD